MSNRKAKQVCALQQYFGGPASYEHKCSIKYKGSYPQKILIYWGTIVPEIQMSRVMAGVAFARAVPAKLRRVRHVPRDLRFLRVILPKGPCSYIV